MKKKILLTLSLVLVLVCTSGCTANYTLKYENDTFTENLHVKGTSEDDAHPTYVDILENGLYADIGGKEYFESTPTSSKYDVTLNHELKDVTLKQLKAVSECFTLSTYKEVEGSYYMYLHGDFTCNYLEDSTFTLETAAKVLINNAHEVKDNQYIWHLDSDSLGDEGIKFQIMKTTVKQANVINDSILPIWAKILLALLIIGSGVAIIVLLKKVQER